MNEDPRLILSARRPRGEDDHEPTIAAAIAAAQDNPALAEWLEKETAVDKKIADSLRSVQPPHGLRDRIIAGARVSRPAGGGSSSWFERRLFGILRYSEAVAIAALLLLLGVALAYNYFTQTMEDRPWQYVAMEKAAGLEAATVSLDHEDWQFETTTGWLRERACPAPTALPVGLRGLSLFGCSSMKWKSSPMGIVCFRLGKDQEVHLVSIAAKDIPDSLSGTPIWQDVGGYMTAQWVEDGTAYMLMGRVPRATLEPLLAVKTAALTLRSRSFFL